MNSPERHPQRPHRSMREPSDYPVSSEPESLSDSDWLDIAGTDRESDDNDSIFSSSRDTDHERPSLRSRSRQSSVSYGSSRDGDIDVWEGMIDDSADEDLPDHVRASSPPPPGPSPAAHPVSHPATHAHEQTSLDDELREKEGLDQSMVSTLSSSRSSSVHAPTVHNSLRDLRLSFPDPISSSREELVTSSYEDVSASPDATPPSTSDSYVIQTSQQHTPDEAPSVPEPASTIQDSLPSGAASSSEFNVDLYGLSTPLKWSVIGDLLAKVAQGAGVTIATDVEDLDGPVRRFVVTRRPSHAKLFPGTVTVTDKTQQQYTPAGSSLAYSTSFPPLAIVYMPSCPPRLPEPAFYLPVLTIPSYSSDSGEFSNTSCSTTQETWNLFNIPDHQVLRLTPTGGPAVVDEHIITNLDPSSAYHAFYRMWSNNKKSSTKASLSGTHTWTILAFLSLLLGVIVRATFHSADRVVTPTAVAGTIPENCSSTSLWQLLRPAIERPRPASVESSASSLKDFALSVFSAESTSVSLHHTHSPSLHRVASSVLQEHLIFTTDLVLRPTLSVLVPVKEAKAVSVVPSITEGLASTPSSLTSAIQTSAYSVLKEYAPILTAAVANDMQAILDALDALVHAISKQVQTFVTEAAILAHRSLSHLEKGTEALGSIKDAIYLRNARAQARARQLKDRGTKWLFEAGEAVASRAQFSKGKARVVEDARVFVEGVAKRARHARGNAKKVAEEIQELLQEQEKLAVRAWDMGERQWRRWQKRHGKACKAKRYLRRAVPC